MSAACETRFPKLVDRAFVRGLPARQRRALRDHLATCDACRERWGRLAIVERQMGGPRLSDAVIEDIGDAVLVSRRPRRVWWVAATAGALASAMIALLVLRPDPPDSGFTPRGKPSLGRTLGVRLFCVAGDADHVRQEARMVSAGPLPELRCTIDDDLQLAYTSPDREGLTMVAFARLDSTVIQYAPTPNRPDAMTLRANRIDELLDWSTRLSAEHRPGTYDVVVRFFEQPVRARDAIGGRVTPAVELRARVEVTARGGADDAR